MDIIHNIELTYVKKGGKPYSHGHSKSDISITYVNLFLNKIIYFYFVTLQMIISVVTLYWNLFLILVSDVRG